MATKYRVRVTNEFTSTTGAAVRRCGGIEVPVIDGFLGELKDEQLAEILADQCLTVTNEDGSELAGAPTGPSFAELKSRAKELGLAANGNKAELAARIAEAEAAANSQGDKEPNTEA